MVKVEVLSVRQPKWANEEQSSILCYIRTNTLINEVPFIASPNDCEQHGRDIFAKCLAGEFGEIAPMDEVNLPFPAVDTSLPIPPQVERLQRFLVVANGENSRKSFRSVVIVWGSLLDSLLDEVLEAAAISARKSGLPFGKPPKDFYERIERALALDLIDSSEAKRCHCIRRIRNAAAHEWELTLDTKNVLSSLRELHDLDHAHEFVFHEDLDFLLQMEYSASCATMAMKLISQL